MHNDGEKLHHTWTMKPNGDIVGNASMEARGNTVMIDYIMRIPYKKGTLDIDVRVSRRCLFVSCKHFKSPTHNSSFD